MSSLDEEGREERWETLEWNFEEEKSRRERLEEKLVELQELLQAKQASSPDDLKKATDELKPQEAKDNLPVTEEQPLPSYSPSEEEGLPRLTSLYGSALQDSKNLQRVSLERPEKFSGTELEDSPYALTYWYRDVLCWCQAYAYERPAEQLVLAINQTLTGTAKAMVQNLIMRDANALQSVDDLFAYLKRTFQSHDPGPEAWQEFHTTRMRRTENAVQFLNRLVQLTFVVNASYSPLCRTLTDHDIAARLQHGLPSSLQRALYKHLNHLIEVDKVPDMQPGSLAAVIFKLEREMQEQSGRDSKDAAGKWTSRRLPSRNTHGTHRASPVSANGMAAALSAQPPNLSKDLAAAKRQRKRFDDLSDEQKQSITKVQQQLGNKALGAKLSPEEQNLCLAHSLCLRCRRYGHDQSGCKMASVMGASKN